MTERETTGTLRGHRADGLGHTNPPESCRCHEQAAEQVAVDWLTEIRRLQIECGLTTEQAIQQANRTHGEGR